MIGIDGSASRRSFWSRALLAGILLGILMPGAGAMARAQRVYPPTPPDWPGDGIGASRGPAVDPATAAMLRKRQIALNAERQKEMVADSHRLVKLAAELNAQINDQHQARLTADQLRMLAEIEKLARNVKDKMTNAVSGAPPIGSPPPILPIP